jgi:hypothetical protein
MICKCSSWSDSDLTHRLLTGHHKDCKDCKVLLRDAAVDLVHKLSIAMDAWAEDDGEVHPDAWDAYSRSKLETDLTVEEAIQLIHDIAAGMDAWAADTDGMYDPAWEHYKLAKFLGGTIVQDDHIF